VIGHLGARASALLDGQLPPAEAERLWAHVHGCPLCRDLVEREGWVKTRLSGLAAREGTRAPDHLKGALLGACSMPPARTPADRVTPYGQTPYGHGPGLPPLVRTGSAGSATTPRVRRTAVLAGVGGAAGMAVLGVLALGTAPADAPTVDRRAPVADLDRVTPQPGEGASLLLPVGRGIRP
jgi:hypothetical protein